MLAWLIYDKAASIRNASYIQMHMDEGEKLGITFCLLYLEDITIGVEDNRSFVYYEGNLMERPDFVINRSISPFLSEQLEKMNYVVFNNAKVARICNDKAMTYQYLADKGISMPDTMFVPNTNLKITLEYIKKKMVVKAVAGHGGSQVCLYDPEEPEKIDEIVAMMNGSNAVVQQFIEGKGQDLRVYILGNKVIACVLRTSKEGFRSNYSLGGEVCAYTLTDNQMELVEEIISQFEFGLVGIDFILDTEGNLIFNEIEDVVGARMLYATHDINLVSLYLQYILDKI